MEQLSILRYSLESSLRYSLIQTPRTAITLSPGDPPSLNLDADTKENHAHCSL